MVIVEVAKNEVLPELLLMKQLFFVFMIYVLEEVFPAVSR